MADGHARRVDAIRFGLGVRALRRRRRWSQGRLAATTMCRSAATQSARRVTAELRDSLEFRDEDRIRNRPRTNGRTDPNGGDDVVI